MRSLLFGIIAGFTHYSNVEYDEALIQNVVININGIPKTKTKKILRIQSQKDSRRKAIYDNGHVYIFMTFGPTVTCL